YESFVPIGINACKDNALLYYAEDQCPKHSADSRTVATGEQYSSDDRRDDGIKLVVLTTQDIGVSSGDSQDNCQQAGSEGRAYEQENFHPLDRYADVARRVGIPTNAKDPVAERRAQKHPCCQRHQCQGPENFDGKTRKTLDAEIELGCKDRLGGVIAW